MNLEPDWERFWCVVKERFGIAHIQGNREVAQQQLAALPAAKENLALYLIDLEANESEEYWRDALACVTIGETYFLRGDAQIRQLRTIVMPEIVRVAKRDLRRVRIWSAGCSSGEEAYTMAFLAMEAARHWEVEVIGTDINEDALERARSGRYRSHSVRRMAPADEARLLEPITGGGGGFAVRPEIMERVTFRYQNLLGDAPLPGPFDLIAWRNVAIYFSRAVAEEIGVNISSQLSVGGYLLMGEAEAFLGAVGTVVPDLEAGAGFFRRRDQAMPVSPPVAPKPEVKPIKRTEPTPRKIYPTPAITTSVKNVSASNLEARSPLLDAGPSVAAVREALGRGDQARAKRLALSLSAQPKGEAAGTLAFALIAENDGLREKALKGARNALLLDPDYIAAMVALVDWEPTHATAALKRRLWLLLNTIADDVPVPDCVEPTALVLRKRIAPQLGLAEGYKA